MQIRSAKDLKVYQKAYELAMEIFNISKQWPAEEKYSLTDQIREQKMSITGLIQGWRERLCLLN